MSNQLREAIKNIQTIDYNSIDDKATYGKLGDILNEADITSILSAVIEALPEEHGNDHSNELLTAELYSNIKHEAWAKGRDDTLHHIKSLLEEAKKQ